MDASDVWGNFFKGEVRFINQGLFNAKYSLVSNGSIIASVQILAAA